MRTRRMLIAIVSVIVALGTIGVHAATIRVPAEQPTIQAGIDAASAGDTVLVAAGTYTGIMNRDIDFHGVNITLESESGYLNTYIDCGNVARGIVFSSGEDTTLVVRGFTIEGAFADNGGAVVCVNTSSPRFEDCVFQNNTVTDIGGAVACMETSKPIFRDCTFGMNTATGGPSPRGGAVACLDNSNAVFNRCSFWGNTAGAFGGGIHCQGSSPSVRHCVFTYNEATTEGGGAIFAMVASAPEIESCTFIGNTAQSHGGAIHGQDSPVTVSDCLFSYNEAWGWGGALSFLYSGSTGQFTDCTFVGNSASAGGVLYCYDDANLSFGNCTFDSNEAADASLLWANNASPVVTRSIVAFSQGDHPTECGGGAVPVFFRCVVYGNAGGDELCGAVSDTLRRNPLFCDAAGADWSLCEDSVCDGANNAWGELIGSKPVGCGACGSPVEATTWGSIKALFR